MSAELLFVIILIVGALLTFLGIKAPVIILTIIGAIMSLIGLYGVFTSLL